MNSAAIPLLGDLIPLLGRQIPLFDSVAEFASDSNEISNLQGQFRPANGLSRRFSLFFPRRTAESGRGGPVMLP
jgi:hypothetical protein